MLDRNYRTDQPGSNCKGQARLDGAAEGAETKQRVETSRRRQCANRVHKHVLPKATAWLDQVCLGKSNRADRCDQTAARSPDLNGTEAVRSCGCSAMAAKAGNLGAALSKCLPTAAAQKRLSWVRMLQRKCRTRCKHSLLQSWCSAERDVKIDTQANLKLVFDRKRAELLRWGNARRSSL